MSVENRFWIAMGCVALSSAGALAAVGFHGPDELIAPDRRAGWGRAVDMQFFHGIGLILVGLAADRLGGSWLFRAAALAMLTGIVLFSGVIYAQALGLPDVLGRVVPAGGVLLMLSWALLAIAVVRR